MERDDATLILSSSERFLRVDLRVVEDGAAASSSFVSLDSFFLDDLAIVLMLMMVIRLS